DDIPPQHRQYEHREGERVAVDVLEDEGEAWLPAVLRARVGDAAGRRRPEEGAVVGAAVVVAGHAERERRSDDEERGREVVPVADDRERRMDAAGRKAR